MDKQGLSIPASSNYRTPQEIAVEFNKSGIQKNAFGNTRLMVYSILGGAFIALGGMLSMVVAGGMPELSASNPGLVKFIFGALFPVGLVLVVIAGAELFTSDCAVLPFTVMNKQLALKNLLRVWCVVYIGNFIGALVIAYFLAYRTGLLVPDPWHTAAVDLAAHKTQGDFTTIFIKGIGANWLVCMAVWLSYAAKDVMGKVIGLFLPVMCFVAFGFEHSIANMFFIPVAMFLGAPIGIQDFLIGNLVPATLGNIAGGVLFVAFPYWFMFSKNISADRRNTEIKNNNMGSASIKKSKSPVIKHLN